MKCPKCGTVSKAKPFNVIDDNTHYSFPKGKMCNVCDHEWDVQPPPIGPTELLRLIKKAQIEGSWRTPAEILDAIKSYLTGDPEPLKKLAAGE